MIAEAADQLKALQRAVMRELEGLWEQVQGAGGGEHVERQVTQWSRRMGCRVLEAALQAQVEGREREQIICCGEAMHRRARERREALTMLGSVKVWRRYFRCRVCGAHRRPADAWLGWRGRFSFAVEELVAWECAGLPYREAVESLEKLAGLPVSVHGAEDIAARWGKDGLKLSAYAERVKKDLVIEIDGSKAHLEEGWKEIKVAACFSWDRANPEAEPEKVTYCADWESAERFRKTVWREALVRGVSGARSLAVVGDGAPWIWELVSEIFPYATQILDWYHLTEHLRAAAEVVHGPGKPYTDALVERWETEMREGRSEGVEEELRELVAAGKDDRDNTLRKCADYLQTNQARVRYHLFRAMGWPIGSGVVEGACKHVVGLRFKRQSTRWSRAGARAVLHLRLDRLSNRWEHRAQLLRQAA
jgi:hypothetical protein